MTGGKSEVLEGKDGAEHSLVGPLHRLHLPVRGPFDCLVSGWHPLPLVEGVRFRRRLPANAALCIIGSAEILVHVTSVS